MFILLFPVITPRKTRSTKRILEPANGVRYAPSGYGWAGGDNAILTEPAWSHATCLKTRRVPPVGCTRCWAAVLVLELPPFLCLSIEKGQKYKGLKHSDTPQDHKRGLPLLEKQKLAVRIYIANLIGKGISIWFDWR